MAEYHILFGFKEEVIVPKIVAAIRSGGNTVTYTERTTKESIAAYLENNTDCTCAVLRECMGSESFSAVDFANLTDTRDINIVALIEQGHKGTTFMDTLYAAGITGGIFVSPQKGASPGKIAELLLNKRTRKVARKYYGLQDGEVRIEVLTYGEYIMNYSILMNTELGINIVDRFLGIVKRLSPKQVAQFIKSLPVNVLKELQGYEEFWLVIEALKKSKITITGTKPTVLKKGLTEEQFRQAVQSDRSFRKKKGIQGPRGVVTRKDAVQEQDNVDLGTTAEAEVTEQNTVLEENYFEQQLKNKNEPVVSEPDEKVGGKEVVSESTMGTPEPTVNKKSKKKRKSDKKKGNWIYMALIIILSILVIAAWCYLVFVYKI